MEDISKGALDSPYCGGRGFVSLEIADNYPSAAFPKRHRSIALFGIEASIFKNSNNLFRKFLCFLIKELPKHDYFALWGRNIVEVRHYLGVLFRRDCSWLPSGNFPLQRQL